MRGSISGGAAVLLPALREGTGRQVAQSSALKHSAAPAYENASMAWRFATRPSLPRLPFLREKICDVGGGRGQARSPDM